MKDTEIEIQVKVDRVTNLIAFLKNNAKHLRSTHQIDEYYTPKHRNFISPRPIKEWLRLRCAENESSITYKNWVYGKSGKSWHCDEYETKIESLDQMRKIFKVMNFKLLIKVNKKREIWKHKAFEISIDKVKGLGKFIEIEYKGKSKKKITEIVHDMTTFLKEQKCGKLYTNNGGYAFVLLFPKEVEFEELKT